VRHVEIEIHSLAVTPERLAELEQWLSPDEILRRDRFVFLKDQQSYSAGRGILREILAKRLAADPRELEFTYTRYGKPSLRGARLEFNVSHSGGVAIYAVSPTRVVGVDIEKIEPRFTEDQIAEKFFSPSELIALRSLPEALQVDAFFRCWTRKEAYVKAHGAGLSIPLDSFDVTLRPDEPAAFLRGVEGWSIEGLETLPGYAAGVVGSEPRP